MRPAKIKRVGQRYVVVAAWGVWPAGQPETGFPTPQSAAMWAERHGYTIGGGTHITTDHTRSYGPRR